MINVYAFSYWDILVSMNQDMMDQGMTVVVTVEIHWSEQSETQRQGQLSINIFKNNMILREPPEDHSGQVVYDKKIFNGVFGLFIPDFYNQSKTAKVQSLTLKTHNIL